MTNSDLESLRAIAASVGEELAARDDVAAVVLVGSVAAGYADEYSDVDLQVVGPAEGGQRSVDGVHIEWTPVTTGEIEDNLAGWEDDAALFTYATAELLHDEAGLADFLGSYEAYPPEVRREKLYAGWFHGSGEAFDARKAGKRGDARGQRCAAVAAVEQFTALAYVLEGRFPPYRSWLFHDLPMELPGVDAALDGDVDALGELTDHMASQLRPELDADRIESPYLFQPEFGPLG